MKILILSWRDIKHPLSGGAEVLTFEVARRWIQKGTQVTWFSARTSSQKKEEIIEGINFIRRGSFFTVHLWAFYFYLNYWKGKYDIVIDQIHGLPFFSPLYIKEKIIAFICEVADQIWFLEWPFPINILGKLIEKFYFSIYRHISFLTISQSTKKELISNGITKIKVIYPGIGEPPPLTKYAKEPEPTFIYLGRLTKMKRVDEAIRTLPEVVKEFPQVKLLIIGQGKDKYEQKLKLLVKKLSLDKNIIFKGFLPEGKKWELLAKSWAIISTSVKEGWGLIVIEANSVGTPAIAYRVPGLTESIKDCQTGLLTKSNDPATLASLLKEYIKDKQLQQKLSKNAKEWSANFSWQKSADEILEFLLLEINRKKNQTSTSR